MATNFRSLALDLTALDSEHLKDTLKVLEVKSLRAKGIREAAQAGQEVVVILIFDFRFERPRSTCKNKVSSIVCPFVPLLYRSK